MGRGTSNRTRLWMAVDELERAWWAAEELKNPEIAKDRNMPAYLNGKMRRSLGNSLSYSKWFKRHFTDYVKLAHTELRNGLEALDSLPPHRLRGKPYLLWYFAEHYQLDFIIKPAQMTGQRSAKKQKARSKYDYLNYNPKNPEDLKSRKQAQFYHLLVNHFLGREWGSALKALYQKHRVKYRRQRTDAGVKLIGEDLVEFRMKLEGHSLFIPALPKDSSDEQGDIEP